MKRFLSHALESALVATLLFATTGCASHQRPIRQAGVDTVTATTSDLSESELRIELMSFADRYATTTHEALLEMEKRLEPDNLEARELGLRHRTSSLPAMYELAVAPDVNVALLDILVLTSLSRELWADQWQEVFGEAGAPMGSALEQAEREVWSIAARVLTPAQQSELKALIEGYCADHPALQAVSHLRLAEIGRTSSALTKAQQPGGFFGVAQAVSEMEAARQQVERTVWMLGRLQIIARWQVELAVMQILQNPVLEGLMSDAEELVAFLPALPDQLGDQGLEIVDRLLEGIRAERIATLEMLGAEEGPRALIDELQQTVRATNDLVSRLDELLRRVDSMTSGPTPLVSRPVDPVEYQSAIVAAGETADRLTRLVGEVDELLGSAEAAVTATRLEERGRGLVNRLFARGLILVGLLVLGQLVVLTIHRAVIVRWFGAKPEGEK